MTDTSRETIRKRWEPFAVPLVALALLGAFQGVQDRFPDGIASRPVQLLSQLRSTEPPADSSRTIAALRDTAEELARLDTVKAWQERMASVLKDSAGIVPIVDPERLATVFQALKEGKGARIAWFGDSFIEGDILVQDVREVLQKVFGGKGVGFVPVTSVTAQFRQSVHHTYSRDWDELSILSRHLPVPPGISGHVFFPARTEDSTQGSWLDLQGAARSGSASFDRIRILYAGGKDSLASVAFQGSRRLLSTTPGLHLAEFRTPGTTRARLVFQTRDSLPVHGVSLEGDSAGIQVDNFSFRGNSGTGLLRIPVDVLRQTDRLLGGYRLVVLEYGTNVTDPTMAGFGWYGKKMTEVVAHLRAAFPQAAFLLIGVGDRGSRTAEGIVSNPAVARILEAQRRAAKESGCAFWDLREAMGGEGAMAVWSRAGLASADFTHISPGGGRRLGKAFAKAFLKAWEATR